MSCHLSISNAKLHILRRQPPSPPSGWAEIPIVSIPLVPLVLPVSCLQVLSISELVYSIVVDPVGVRLSYLVGCFVSDPSVPTSTFACTKVAAHHYHLELLLVLARLQVLVCCIEPCECLTRRCPLLRRAVGACNVERSVGGAAMFRFRHTYRVPQLCPDGKLCIELCRLDLSPRNPLLETESPIPTVCMDCPTKGAQEDHEAELSEIDDTTMAAKLVRRPRSCAGTRTHRLFQTNPRGGRRMKQPIGAWTEHPWYSAGTAGNEDLRWEGKVDAAANAKVAPRGREKKRRARKRTSF